MKPQIIHLADFAHDAAAFIAHAAVESIEARGEFRLSLCGGNTPRPVFRALADQPVDWSRVLITFSDERCVPPDHPESNYGMARDTLLSHIPIPAEKIVRLQGELEPTFAAHAYAQKLHALAPAEPRFVHDLLLLGIGEDGHCASLFPGTAALDETERSVVDNYVPKFSAHRLTFTFPLINAARVVCFIVQGKTKQPLVEAIAAGDPQYPASRVQPHSGLVTWLLGA